MSPRTALIFVLAAAPVQARGMLLVLPSGVKLQTAQVAPCDDADVCLRNNRVEVASGIRLESSAMGFMPAAPVVLETPYQVKDAAGGQYRMWIHDVTNGRASVEVVSEKDPIASEDTSGMAGRYKVTKVMIAGEDSDARYPDLRLDAEGNYRIGSSSGAWTTDRRSLSLSGHFASWGMAEVDAAAQTLTFRFRRATLEFEVVLQRTDANGGLTASR